MRQHRSENLVAIFGGIITVVHIKPFPSEIATDLFLLLKLGRTFLALFLLALALLQ